MLGVKDSDYLRNELLQHAMVMALLTIGECANHFTDEFAETHKEVRWNKIVSMRNIAAHGYWVLDHKRVWNTVTKDMPKLKEHLLNIRD